VPKKARLQENLAKSPIVGGLLFRETDRQVIARKARHGSHRRLHVSGVGDNQMVAAQDGIQ